MTNVQSHKLNRESKVFVAQLRAGSLTPAAEAETESFLKNNVCDLWVVEDEFHCVFNFSLFTDLRKCLFDKVQVKNLIWYLSQLLNVENLVLAAETDVLF